MYLFINKYLLFKINRSNFLVCFLFLKTLMHWVFVAACRSFSGGMWTLSWDMWHLVPWPEIEPGHPTLGAWSLSHWTTRQVPQKQKFIFLLFLRGRTFRDHFDQMRKLGLSLNLVNYLTSLSLGFLLFCFYSREYLPQITVSLLLETIISWIEFPLCLRVCCAFASFPNYLGNISLSLASLVAQRLKRLPPMRETRVWSLGWEYPPWRRKCQPTPVFLPGESHGWRSLVDYSPWGHKESDMTERLSLSLFSLQLSFVFTLWPSFFLSLPPLNLFTSLSWRIQMNHQCAVWKGPKGRSFCPLGTGVAHPPRVEMCSPTWEHQGCF